MALTVLVACEFSGTVRDAFIKRGHNAISCDLIGSEQPGPHYKGDVLDIIHNQWDLIIAHPPCTYLAVSGNEWFKDQPPRRSGVLVGEARRQAREQAIDFFMAFANTKCDRVAIENPIGVMSTRFRKPDQIINPWEFGHEESKKTCLWLKGLPKLTVTKVMDVRNKNLTPTNQNKLGPSPTRAMDRSRTYTGIAEAMAQQWG